MPAVNPNKSKAEEVKDQNESVENKEENNEEQQINDQSDQNVQSSEPELPQTPPVNETQLKTEPKVVKNVDPNQLVEVYSNTHGKLVYAPRNGNGISYTWPDHGEMRLMTVKELLEMTSQRAFFENQWIHVKDETAKEYLRISHFFEKEITDDVIKGHILNYSVEALEKFINDSNRNIKIKIIDIARELVKTGELSNFRTIGVLEKKFGTELKDAV